MHSRTFVLVPPDAPDLRRAGAALLRAHLVDDDAPADARGPRRLDYWTTGRGEIGDPVTAAALGVSDDSDLAGNVCRVSRLPPDVVPAAVVTPDGRWHDLADHGHRPVRGDTPENRAAEAAWRAAARALLAEYPSHVAVAFDTHA